MILTVETHAPGSVFDANGQELLYVICADTETGEAFHLVKGDDGRFQITRDDTGREVVAKVWQRHPAPLVYHPHRPAKCATHESNALTASPRWRACLAGSSD